MPLPWLFNQWACNPFAAEPDRNAAVDREALGISFQTRPEDIIATPLEPVGDEADYSPADWYASLTADWPSVANVIPKSLHVFKSDETEVLEFVNASLPPDQQRTSLQCFHYAWYQLDVAGFVRRARRPCRMTAFLSCTSMRSRTGSAASCRSRRWWRPSST